MKFLGKPKNRWGWVRIGGWVVLAAMILWTILAAAFTFWSGWKVYSLLDRFEFAVAPLLAVFAAGWLEEHDHRVLTEQAQHQEAEQAAADQRKEILKRMHASITAELPERHSSGAQLLEQNRLRIGELVFAALPNLDGKGRGELLHFLYEKGLLSGEHQAVDLRGADLVGAYLHKAHFNAICLAGADLASAQMDGCRLAQARLSDANLKKAFLRHADLREAALAGSQLNRARLEHANLEAANLTSAALTNAFLAYANLKHTTGTTPEMLEQAVLIDTILTDGSKVTNEKGKEYLRKKEIAVLIDRL